MILGSPLVLLVLMQGVVVVFQPATNVGTALGIAWAMWTTFAVIGGLVLRASAPSCFCGTMAVDDDDAAALKPPAERPRGPFCQTCGRLWDE